MTASRSPVRAGAACCALALLAGCAAQGAASSPVPEIGAIPAGAAVAPSAATAPVHFAFKIPPARHEAHYVSPSTKSVAILVYNAKRTTQLASFKHDLTLGNRGCSQLRTGAVLCTFAFELPVGQLRFDVTAYDRKSAPSLTIANGFTKACGSGPMAVAESGDLYVATGLECPQVPRARLPSGATSPFLTIRSGISGPAALALGLHD